MADAIDRIFMGVLIGMLMAVLLLVMARSLQPLPPEPVQPDDDDPHVVIVR